MAVDLDERDAPAGGSASHAVVSLASEVYWTLLAATKAQARERHGELAARYLASPGLADRVAGFWGDGGDGAAHFDELGVLAHAGGVLAGSPPVDDFVDSVREAAAHVPGGLRLGSESPEHRDRLLVRLGRLRRDRGLRSRYARLLGEVWSPLDAAWRAELPALLAAAARLDGLLATGVAWTELLPLDCDLSHFAAFRQAPGREIVASTPGVLSVSRFAAKFAVIDLGDALFCSMAPPGVAAAERDRAVALGRQARAVADPTRLALLRLLASEDRRVTDLAAILGVSQPTVSNHLKVLKASGLVRAERRDGRQLLAVDQPALERVLAGIAEFVAPHEDR